MNTADDYYALRLRTGCRIAGCRYAAGTLLRVSPTRLRVAAHLVRTGAARPADETTRRDVELFQLLDRALPR